MFTHTPLQGGGSGWLLDQHNPSSAQGTMQGGNQAPSFSRQQGHCLAAGYARLLQTRLAQRKALVQGLLSLN